MASSDWEPFGYGSGCQERRLEGQCFVHFGCLNMVTELVLTSKTGENIWFIFNTHCLFNYPLCIEVTFIEYLTQRDVAESNMGDFSRARLCELPLSNFKADLFHFFVRLIRLPFIFYACSV